MGEAENLRPKPVSQYLLERIRKAGVKKAYFIWREGEGNTPAYFGDEAMLDMHLAYVVIPGSFGPPDTLN